MNIKELKCFLDCKFPSKFTFYPWNCSQKIEHVDETKRKLLSIRIKTVEDDLIGDYSVFAMNTVNGIQQVYKPSNIDTLIQNIEKELGRKAQ